LTGRVFNRDSAVAVAYPDVSGPAHHIGRCRHLKWRLVTRVLGLPMVRLETSLVLPYLKTAWLGMVGLAVAGVGVTDRNLLLFLALARDLVHEENEGSHDSKVQ
jgi:hypothetical protein